MPDTATEPASATDTWTQQLADLKARYKHVHEPVLVALNILLHDQNIPVGDAKSQAALHGTRITLASLNAARTLLSRMDSPPTPTPVLVAPRRVGRRSTSSDKSVSAESMVRAFVARLQDRGNAEGERLRDAMRKAIAVLQAAVDGR